jgi:hypothetical protein
MLTGIMVEFVPMETWLPIWVDFHSVLFLLAGPPILKGSLMNITP